MTKIIISKTGKIRGRGSDPYRWVSGLTQEEKTAVREGSALVVVKTENPDHYIRHGSTLYKKVICSGRIFYHRNTTPDEEAAILASLVL